MYEIINNYRNNTTLRQSFNKLAEKTFGINFEDWYQKGFWGDDYNQYSIVIDGNVAANISVNKTDMVADGVVRHFLQLGTVMTDEAYRNRGLSRSIMERIQADYDGKVDGIYLFANDSVLEFYPKFGFKQSKEYQYSKKVSNTKERQINKVDMNNDSTREDFVNAINSNVFESRLYMVNNSGLIMFYAAGFMQDNVYYHKDTDTYVIADAEGERLYIHNVFSRKSVELDAVIGLFGKEIKEVTLGFVPMETSDYDAVEIQGEDECTLFIKGECLEIIEKEKLRIPSLAHA